MSGDIGVGDVVECIRCRKDVTWGAGFSIGARYVVSGVGICPVYSDPWLHLAGMPTPRDLGHNSAGWALRAFRKIGGSQSDTATRFAHHLITDKPKVRA